MATTTPPSPTDMTGQVMTEAVRRMAPVLVSKLLTAVADQGVARIEQLAERLDQSRERSAAGPQEVEGGEADASEGSGSSGLGGIGAFLMAQARALLDLVVRLVAQAAEMLRRATERLRSRRAPEGIEAEAEEIEAEDAELDDAELEDTELEDTGLDDDAELDEDEDARVPA